MRHKKERRLDPEAEKLIDELAEKINQNEMRFWQALEIIKLYCKEKEKEVETNGNSGGPKQLLLSRYERHGGFAPEKNNSQQAR